MEIRATRKVLATTDEVDDRIRENRGWDRETWTRGGLGYLRNQLITMNRFRIVYCKALDVANWSIQTTRAVAVCRNLFWVCEFVHINDLSELVKLIDNVDGHSDFDSNPWLCQINPTLLPRFCNILYPWFGLFQLQWKTNLDLVFLPSLLLLGMVLMIIVLEEARTYWTCQACQDCHSTASGQSQSLDAGSSILILTVIVNLKFYTRRSATQELLYTEPKHEPR